MALPQVSTGGNANSNRSSLETRPAAMAKKIQWAVPVKESSADQFCDMVITVLNVLISVHFILKFLDRKSVV